MAADDGNPAPGAVGKSIGELGKRIASAVVLIVVALFTAYEGGWPFALFWLAAGIAMMVEWTNMTRVEPRTPVQIVLGLGIVALTALFLGGAGLWAGFAAALAAIVLGGAVARGT